MRIYHPLGQQLVVFSALAITCACALAQPNELTILYTGRLLGYARTPDIQRVCQWGWRVNGKPQKASTQVSKQCDAPKADCQRLYKPVEGKEPSPAAAALTKLIAAERANAGPQALLLGMGDNFAMDYFSRVVVAKTYEGNEEYVPKDELFFHESSMKKWLDLRTLREGESFKAIQEDQWSGKTAIPNDNVATFFASAKYDALVPGKHDFYYGPERLRQLARLLAESGTQMLAANLILQTKVADAPVPVAEQIRAKKRKFETAVGKMKWSVPKTVLPWLRTFHLKNYRDASGEKLVDPSASAELCETDNRDVKPKSCWPLPAKSSDGPQTGKTTEELLYHFSEDRRKVPIPSERTYLLCAKLLKPTDLEKPDICQAVDVSTPFFQYPDLAKRELVTGQEIGYAGNQKIMDHPNLRNIGVKEWKEWLDRPGTVVMGVVQPGIESSVGALNATYTNAKEKYDTYATAIDPSEALRQLIEFCLEKGACVANETTMVLMAQMPGDEAAILNDRMDGAFAVVLAQADGRFPTAPEEVTYSAGHRPIVLVPGELIGKDGKSVRLNVAKLTGLAPSRKIVVTTRATKPLPITVNGCAKSDCLTERVTCAWKKATREKEVTKDPDNDASRFRIVVLNALRDALHADVALIQERDFYDLAGGLTVCQNWPITSPRAQMQAAIEQILWKGDFAISRTITGAALKSALKESERLKNVEETSYHPEHETRRWLHHLGLAQDPETLTWYVNGGAIDDKTTYSVAMTDFLGSGDTGYADLKDPAVPPGQRPQTMPSLMRVSEAVMRKLSSLPGPPGVDASTYLDQSNHAAFPQQGNATFLNQVAAITRGLFKMHPKLDTPTDRLGQTRPYWRLFLDKGEIGFNDYRHNKTTQDQLSAQFAGTSQSGVLARKTGTLPLAVQVEARREFTGHHFFGRTEIAYTRMETQQDGPAGRFLTTYPSNKITIESGYRSTFGGTMRSRPWNGWLLSAYAESNLHRPVVDGVMAGVTGCTATGTTPCPSKISYASDLPRTNRLLAKAGFRRENEQNWLEAGLFAGAVFRPTDFTVRQNGALVPAAGEAGACRLANLVSNGSPMQLNDCLQKLFLVAVATPDAADAVGQTLSLDGRTGSKPETGVFLNFNFRIPVPRNWVVKDLYIEQRGAWFVNHSGDTVVDARLNETISFGPTLAVIPSLPGLSLRPTYTLFFYENKIVRHLLEGKTLEIRLDYRFDWKSGTSWRQVLRYGRPK